MSETSVEEEGGRHNGSPSAGEPLTVRHDRPETYVIFFDRYCNDVDFLRNSHRMYFGPASAEIPPGQTLLLKYEKQKLPQDKSWKRKSGGPARIKKRSAVSGIHYRMHIYEDVLVRNPHVHKHVCRFHHEQRSPEMPVIPYVLIHYFEGEAEEPMSPAQSPTRSSSGTQRSSSSPRITRRARAHPEKVKEMEWVSEVASFSPQRGVPATVASAPPSPAIGANPRVVVREGTFAQPTFAQPTLAFSSHGRPRRLSDVVTCGEYVLEGDGLVPGAPLVQRPQKGLRARVETHNIAGMRPAPPPAMGRWHTVPHMQPRVHRNSPPLARVGDGGEGDGGEEVVAADHRLLAGVDRPSQGVRFEQDGQRGTPTLLFTHELPWGGDMSAYGMQNGFAGAQRDAMEYPGFACAVTSGEDVEMNHEDDEMDVSPERSPHDEGLQQSPLIASICSNDIDEVRRQLNEDVDGSLERWQMVDRESFPPIHFAVSCGNLRSVQAMLEHDVGLLFARDTKGRNVLHVAACHGHVDVVSWLLNGSHHEKARALVAMCDHKLRHPLFSAAKAANDQQLIVALIIGAGADVCATTSLGRNALHAALLKKNVKVARLLMDELHRLGLLRDALLHKDVNGEFPKRIAHVLELNRSPAFAGSPAWAFLQDDSAPGFDVDQFLDIGDASG